MTELVLEKLIFARSEAYDELFFFIAFAYDQHKTEYKIQGIATPELNMVSRVELSLAKLIGVELS